jgi:hypothetical protein
MHALNEGWGVEATCMSVDYDGWPVLRFNVIKNAWRLYKRHALVWSLATLIVMFADSLVSGMLLGMLGGGKPFHHGGFRLFQPASELLQVLVCTVVTGFLLGGMIRMANNQIRGQAPRVEDLFSVKEHWFDLVLVSFLIGVATTIGHMLFVVPGFIVSGLLMLAIPLVVEGRLPATGALIQSWDALKSQWLTAAVFHFVLIVASLSGLVLCGIGVLLTGPLYCLAIAQLYNEFYPVVPTHGAWKKDFEPIPEI